MIRGVPNPPTALLDVPARRVVRRWPPFMSLIGASIGYAAALTPSLLPHTLTFLLLLAAVGTITGYGGGTTIGWLLNKIRWIRGHHPKRWVQSTIMVLVSLSALAFTPVSVNWQDQQQDALHMPSALPGSVTVVVVTAILATLLLLLGRSLRLASNKVAALITRGGPLHRWVSGRRPSRVPRAIATVRLGVAALFIGGALLLVNVGVTALISSYDSDNANTSDQSARSVGDNSGSPDSYAPWDTLGREGRYYVGNAMTPADIEAITDQPADQPVRVYVGMQQGDTPQARSTLAVKELDRVKAWDRKYLAIMAATGTGWVDPDAINSMEIVTGGDVTSVAVQYSAVPSWIGFVIDPETTEVQNANTINTILDTWRAKPADQRPELILFGESLGAFGSQAAWPQGASPAEVTEEIGRVIWIGPPSQSRLWKQWQADRTGGPMWQPIIGDGSIARVYNSDVELQGAVPADGPTITITAHPNDPVVYWGPNLLWEKPDWLDSPLGPGVDPHMLWYPVISYLQVGMDLISGGAPPEVGHNYATDIGPAIALTVNPEGWTPQRTQVLAEQLPALRYVTG